MKKTTTTEVLVGARELLDKNLRTIDRELEKIEKISKMDAQIPLVPEYAMALVQYAKTLVAVDKNKKEHPDDDNEDDELKHLSDAELTELARKVIFEKNEKKKK
jgi:hypothetical protein